MTALLFIDVETTGLNPKENAIHQIAGEIAVDGIVVEKIDLRAKPDIGCIIETAALRVSNTKVKDLMNYKSSLKAIEEFNRICRKVISKKEEKILIAGWRAPEFDFLFLQELYKRHNLDFAFAGLFYPFCLDVKSLAINHKISNLKNTISLNLGSTARSLGINVDEEQLHKASYDAYICRKVYEKITTTANT